MKVLLLSAYDAASHQRWRQTITTEFSDFQWQVLTLPPRHFSWRIRGNSLTWSLTQHSLLSAPYDLVIATSMTDLATLRGLVPQLCEVPTLLYFHENQFSYPQNKSRHGAVEAQMVSIYSALAADGLAFNSNYNLDTFMQGVSRLLSKLPDHVPEGIVEQLKVKSCVLPVPILAQAPVASRPNRPDKLSVVWNHRWEYDKGPDRLLRLISALAKAEYGHYELHIIGQQFRSLPDEFKQIKMLVAHSPALSLESWGFIESEARYREVLSACDVVLSSALHDFQGLSVLEAVGAGCCPVVPDRLAYQELLDQGYRYEVDENNVDVEVTSAVRKLGILADLKNNKGLLPVPSVEFLTPAVLNEKYLSCFESLIENKRNNGLGSSA